MSAHAVPSMAQVECYVDFKVLNSVSEGLYEKQLKYEVEQQVAASAQALEGHQKVRAFTEHYLQYMQVLGRRDQSGLSLLCRTLPEMAPIAKRDLRLFVGTCDIMGYENRPCFEIRFTRPHRKPMVVHHSLLNHCQQLWAIVHYDVVLQTAVDLFLHDRSTHSLGAVCVAWKTSDDRTKLANFTCMLLHNVYEVFVQNNNGTCTV